MLFGGISEDRKAVAPYLIQNLLGRLKPVERKRVELMGSPLLFPLGSVYLAGFLTSCLTGRSLKNENPRRVVQALPYPGIFKQGIAGNVVATSTAKKLESI